MWRVICALVKAACYLDGMKALLLALLLSCAAESVAQTPSPSEVGTVAALDAKNGFRQYHFGVPISSMIDLTIREKNTYVAPTELMYVGKAQLYSLLFFAKNGKLLGVLLTASGKENIDEILAALTAQYGPGQVAGVNKVGWFGRTVTMYFERTSQAAFGVVGYGKKELGQVYISGNAVAGEADIETEAAGKKAASTL